MVEEVRDFVVVSWFGYLGIGKFRSVETPLEERH